MPLLVLIFFTACSILTVSASVTDLHIVLSLAKLFRGHQWLVDENCKDFVVSLARSGIMAAVATNLTRPYNHLPFIYVLKDTKAVRDFKMNRLKWIWVVIGSDHASIDFHTPVIFISSGVVTHLFNLSISDPFAANTMKVANLEPETVQKLGLLTNNIGHRSFAGATLKVGDDGVFIDCGNNDILDPYEKVKCSHEELMIMIAAVENIKLNVSSLPSDFTPRYAYTFPNGSYAGLFAQLQELSVDISMGSFVAVPDRIRDFSFAWPTFHLRSAMFMKEATREVSWSSYFEPLHVHVWGAALACFSLAAFLLVVVKNSLSIRHNSDRDFDHSEAVFCAFQLLSNQGIAKMPASLVLRCIYLFLLLTIIVLLPAYSGSLISYLTIQRQVVPFTTLEQYLEDGSYKLMTLADGFISWYLRFFSSVDLSRVLVPSSETVLTDDDGYKSVCDHRMTYVTLHAGFSPEKYRCPIMALPITLLVQYFGLALPKNSHLTEKISQSINRFRSVGIINRMNSRFSVGTAHTTNSAPFLSLSVNAILPLLTIWFMGMTIAVLLCVIERRWRLSTKK